MLQKTKDSRSLILGCVLMPRISAMTSLGRGHHRQRPNTDHQAGRPAHPTPWGLPPEIHFHPPLENSDRKEAPRRAVASGHT